MLTRSATRPRRQNSHRADADRRCEPFLKWLRGRDCTLKGKPGHVCQGSVRACHVDYAGGKGVGIKVSDQFAIPMCDGAHAEQTDQLGWGPFELKWFGKEGEALELSKDLWSYWLHGTVMGTEWRRKQAERVA